MKYIISLFAVLVLTSLTMAHPVKRPIVRPIVINPVIIRPAPIIIRPVVVRPIVHQCNNNLYLRQLAAQREIYLINRINERNAYLQSLINKYNIVQNQLINSNDFVLSQALTHIDPIYRLAAVRTIVDRNKIEFAIYLVDRLGDTSLDVQQSARYALNHFFGNDFGPLPGSNFNQINDSILKWKAIIK